MSLTLGNILKAVSIFVVVFILYLAFSSSKQVSDLKENYDLMNRINAEKIETLEESEKDLISTLSKTETRLGKLSEQYKKDISDVRDTLSTIGDEIRVLLDKVTIVEGKMNSDDELEDVLSSITVRVEVIENEVKELKAAEERRKTTHGTSGSSSTKGESITKEDSKKDDKTMDGDADEEEEDEIPGRLDKIISNQNTGDEKTFALENEETVKEDEAIKKIMELTQKKPVEDEEDEEDEEDKDSATKEEIDPNEKVDNTDVEAKADENEEENEGENDLSKTKQGIDEEEQEEDTTEETKEKDEELAKDDTKETLDNKNVEDEVEEEDTEEETKEKDDTETVKKVSEKVASSTGQKQVEQKEED